MVHLLYMLCRKRSAGGHSVVGRKVRMPTLAQLEEHETVMDNTKLWDRQDHLGVACSSQAGRIIFLFSTT